MQKLVKIISILTGVLIFASCETTQSAASTERPVVATPTGTNAQEAFEETSEQAVEAPAEEKKELEGAPDVSNENAESVPVGKTETDSVPVTPDPVPAAKAEEPQAEPSPAPVPAAPESSTPVRFRVAYWQKPENPEELFIKSDGEFRRCEIFEMAFQRSYSVNTPIVLYRQKGEAYEPYICVDSLGFSDCAALILPGYDTENPEGTADRLQVFSFDDKDSPGGSIVIYNWFSDVLEGKFHFRGDAQNPESEQTFSLKFGEHCTTLPIKSRRRICEIELYSGTGEERKLLFSSGMPVRSGQCTYFFAIPKEGGNPERLRPDFKFFQVSK